MVSLLRICSIGLKNLQGLSKDKRTVALLIGMPIIVMIVFGFGFGQEIQNVPINVVNLDKGGIGIPMMNITDTHFSDKAIDYLKNDSRISISFLDSETFDFETEVAKVSGVKNLYALLIFPANFTEDMPFPNRTIKILLYYDGTDALVIASVRAAINQMMTQFMKDISGSEAHLSIEFEAIAGSGDLRPFDSMAPGVLSLAILLFMILTVTGGFTKEKLTGSTERVLISGTTRTEIILGYLIGNSLIALIQCSILLAIARFVFNVVINGSLGLLFLALFIYAMCCVGIGILASSAARTELQAFQFIPLLVIPFMILSGFIYPIAALPTVFQYIAYIIPMTYCIRIGRAIMINGFGLAEIMNDLLILILITVVMLILSIISFKAKRN